jgi:hypothetical protein
LLGRNEEAKTYFEMAYVELGKDEWFVKNESKRLENLRIRGRK